jgi:hypothetical protein
MSAVEDAIAFEVRGKAYVERQADFSRQMMSTAEAVDRGDRIATPDLADSYTDLRGSFMSHRVGKVAFNPRRSRVIRGQISKGKTFTASLPVGWQVSE